MEMGTCPSSGEPPEGDFEQNMVFDNVWSHDPDVMARKYLSGTSLKEKFTERESVIK